LLLSDLERRIRHVALLKNLARSVTGPARSVKDSLQRRKWRLTVLKRRRGGQGFWKRSRSCSRSLVETSETAM
jgi:hypothetical protein